VYTVLHRDGSYEVYAGSKYDPSILVASGNVDTAAYMGASA
jgi:hypothetical protein